MKPHEALVKISGSAGGPLAGSGFFCSHVGNQSLIVTCRAVVEDALRSRAAAAEGRSVWVDRKIQAVPVFEGENLTVLRVSVLVEQPFLSLSETAPPRNTAEILCYHTRGIGSSSVTRPSLVRYDVASNGPHIELRQGYFPISMPLHRGSPVLGQETDGFRAFGVVCGVKAAPETQLAYIEAVYTGELKQWAASPVNLFDPLQVFLSYASEDKAEVGRAHDALQRERFNVWWNDDIRPGDDWGEGLSSPLDAIDVLLVFCSKTAHDSPHVSREITRIECRLKSRRPPRIIPVLLSLDEPFPRLKTYQWIDFRHRNVDGFVRDFIRAVRGEWFGAGGGG